MKCQEVLNQVFQMVFANRNLNVQPEMTPNDIDGWDSMAHVNLIAAIEARFHIKFATKELRSLKTVGDLGALIDSKIA
ncbi:MAG TPA: acyl carrier protein [Polyangia bacterium]|jgi:Acyl carrier protein|nr:acyl carrier protein [Polyangia bacterium]